MGMNADANAARTRDPAPAALNIVITGTIMCDAAQLDMFRAALDAHIRLSRAEPGCLRFEIRPAPDAPGTFLVAERFVDHAAFDAHTARTRASAWWAKTQHMARDLVIGNP